MIDLDFRLPLAHFTLEVRCRTDANVTALVGRSGSGKTSLVETIAGLRHGAAGTVNVGGSTLLDTSQHIDVPPERRRIGYVPQDTALFPHLRVRENILYGGRDPHRFDALCEALELRPLLGRSTTTLSGGERQRVAIARALMSDPRLLLLDEPLASVDQPLRERILIFLRRVRDFGVPMIYVTHQSFEAIALGSWCIVLHDGKVSGEGRPREILDRHPVSGDVDNVFEIANPRHEPEKGITRAVTQDGLELVLPYDRVAGATFPLIVRISGEEIVVFAERPVATSSRNVIDGRIVSMREIDGATDLLVGAATSIRVRITRSAADDLHLQPGVRVWLALRSRSFRVVG